MSVAGTTVCGMNEGNGRRRGIAGPVVFGVAAFIAGALGRGLFQRRIAAGKAEPISDLEREQLQQVREIYVRRFGKAPDTRPHTRLIA